MNPTKILAVLFAIYMVVITYLLTKPEHPTPQIQIIDDSKYQYVIKINDSLITELHSQRKQIYDSLAKLPTNEEIKYIYIPIRNAIDSSKWNDIDSILSEIY
jgi:hypothetical protein